MFSKDPTTKIDEPEALLKCDRIERSIETICEEIPSLGNVANAFRELLLERTRLKEEIPFLAEGPVLSFDPVRFRQGVPLLSVEALVALAASCDNAMYRLLPAMYKGFPKIASELRKFESSVENGLIEPKQCMTAMFDNKAEEMARIASTISMEPGTLQFILAQLFKPYIEKRARAFGSHIKDLPWTKSYCPICGSLPELGFLKGDAGERWLMCSLCGHQWRFPRIMCPFCENVEQDQMEFFYIEGREHERAELCNACKRYLAILDVRKCRKEVAPEVASLGLVHLDILAQQSGFFPVAVSPWNVVCQTDIETTLEVGAINESPDVH